MVFRHGMLPQQNDIGLTPDAVEYLDENDVPFFVAPEAHAPKLGLTRRWVAIALLAPRGKDFCLHMHHCTSAPFIGLWGTSACGAILYGESVTDAARRLALTILPRRADGVETRRPLQPTITVLHELRPADTALIFPPEQFGSIHLTLVRGRYPVPIAADPRDLWLDTTECESFFARYDDRLTPLLRVFIEKNILFTGTCLDD